MAILGVPSDVAIRLQQGVTPYLQLPHLRKQCALTRLDPDRQG